VLVLVAALAGTAQAGGDAVRGAVLFKQNCSPCHSPEPGQNLIGPSLFSVVGRAAASIAGFPYSAAMKGSGITWTPNQLMAYLKAPRRYVPGVRMTFPGLPDAQDRENVVAFLATLTNTAANSTAAASPQLKSTRGGAE
jgi:cytochrome c